MKKYLQSYRRKPTLIMPDDIPGTFPSIFNSTYKMPAACPASTSKQYLQTYLSGPSGNLIYSAERKSEN
jgi:hypothetical protein